MSCYFGKQVSVECCETASSQQCPKVVVGNGAGIGLDKANYRSSAGGLSLWSPGREGVFLTWRVEGDTLTLTEEALTSGCCVSGTRQFVFSNEAILPQIFVREFESNVVMLLATDKSVHRILLRNSNEKQRRHSRLPSGYLSSEAAQIDSYSFLNALGGGNNSSCKVICASFWQHSTLKSSFVLSCEGQLMGKVVMDKDGSSSISSKYLGNSGLLNMFSKKTDQTLYSLMIAHASDNHYVFGVDRASKLHVVSLVGLNQVFELDLTELMSVDSKLITPQANCGHRIKICEKPDLDVHLRDKTELPVICVYLQYEAVKLFLFLKVSVSGLNFNCACIRAVQCERSSNVGEEEQLMDFCFDTDLVYSLWSSSDTGSLTTCRFHHRSYDGSMSRWQQAMTPPVVLDSLPTPEDDQEDLSELYVHFIMNNSSSGGDMFSTASLLKVTLQLRQRQDHSAVDDVEMIQSRSQLKQLIIESVERELLSTLAKYDPQNEEHRSLLTEQWQLFYSMMCEHHCSERSKTVGLLYDAPSSFVGVITKDSWEFILPLSPFENKAHEVFAEAVKEYSITDAEASKLNISAPSVVLANLITFFENISNQLGILEFIRANCLENSDGLSFETVMKKCFDNLVETMNGNEKKKLSRLFDKCTTETLSVAIPFFVQYMTSLLSSNMLGSNEEAGGSSVNKTLNSSVMSFVQARKILRTLVTENCTAIVHNALRMLCPVALLLTALMQHKQFVLVLFKSFETVCKSFHAWMLLQLMCDTEINDSSEALNGSTLSLGKRLEPDTPKMKPSSLYSNLDETANSLPGAQNSQERDLATPRSVFSSNAPDPRKRRNLMKVSFLSHYVEDKCDLILSDIVENKGTVDQTQVVQEVSLKILDSLNISTNSSAMNVIAKHLSSDHPSSILENKPHFVLELCSFTELSFKSDFDHTKAIVDYLKMVSLLRKGEITDAVDVASSLICLDENCLKSLLSLKSFGSVFEVKFHIVSIFEEGKHFSDCLKLVEKMLINHELNNQYRITLSVKRFNCLLELRRLSNCYDAVCDVMKQASQISSSSALDQFRDCLRCWIQAVCETNIESDRHDGDQKDNQTTEWETVNFSEFSCVHFFDELVTCLEQKARFNSPLCPVPFYNCLRKFYANRHMYRSGAIVTLEKAIRIQQEQSMLATTGGMSSGAKDAKLQMCKKIFLEEYKAWQQCEIALRLCPLRDQMLLMPKVAKSGEDPETSGVDGGGVMVLKLNDICQYRALSRLKHHLLCLDDPHLDSEIIINSRSLSREQLMTRAAQYGLFNEAVLFGRTCGLDLSGVFEIMTNFYCEYHKPTKANSSCAAYWLNQNSLPDEAYLAEDEQFKLMLLIKDHLEAAVLDGMDEMHKVKRYYFVVLASLLKNHCIVFTWLLQKIKEWGEEWQLAKVYLKFGYLFLSCQVSCSYLESQMEIMERDESSKPYALFANTKLYRAQLHVLHDMKRKPSSVGNGTEANEWHSRLTDLYEQYIGKLEEKSVAEV